MYKNVKNFFFKRFNKNGFNKSDNNSVNIITGGHLSMIKDLVSMYSSIAKKSTTPVKKLIIVDNESENSNENELSKIIQNDTLFELITTKEILNSNIKEKGKNSSIKDLYDDNTILITELINRKYKINKLIHLNHLVAFNPIQQNDEDNTFLFNEIKRLIEINVKIPFELNALILNKDVLLKKNTQIYHLMPQVSFNIQKYYKPNLILGNLFLLINNSISNKGKAKEYELHFALLNLKTIDKEYIETFKIGFLDNPESNISSEDLNFLSEKIKLYEAQYDSALKMINYVLSEEFNENLKRDNEGKENKLLYNVDDFKY